MRVVVAVVALAALAACGGGKDSGPPATAPGLPVVNNARDTAGDVNQRSDQLDQRVELMDPQPER